MSTDQEYTRLYNKKIMPLDHMKDKFLDYLLAGMRSDVLGLIFRNDGTFDTLVAVAPSASPNKISISFGVPWSATDGRGKALKFLSGETRLANIRIPEGLGDVYHVGVEQADVEKGVGVNPRTGQMEYESFIELPGRVGQPDTVIDNGDGTITFIVNTLMAGGTIFNHADRKVRCWLKSKSDGGIGPVTAIEADAIQEPTVLFIGFQNFVTVNNRMGQADGFVSTNPADYRLQAIGPTVRKMSVEDLRNTPGCVFLAQVTSENFGNPILVGDIDETDQNVIAGGATGLDFDDHVNQSAPLFRHAAKNIDVGPGPVWATGETNPGAFGGGVSTDGVQGRLDRIIAFLAATAGASRVGALASGNLSGNDIQAQLNELDAEKGGLALPNTWTTFNTFDETITTLKSLAAAAGGATDESTPVLITHGNAGIRKKILEVSNSTTLAPIFVYATLRGAPGRSVLEFTFNARWLGGGSWIRDKAGDAAFRVSIISEPGATVENGFVIIIESYTGVPNTFGEYGSVPGWTNRMKLSNSMFGPNDSHHRMLTPKSMTSAWAAFQAAFVSPFTILRGQNVKRVSYVNIGAGPGDIFVEFADGFTMNDTDYIVHINEEEPTNDSILHWTVRNKTVNGFVLRAHEIDPAIVNSFGDPGATITRIDWSLGFQTTGVMVSVVGLAATPPP